MENVERLIDQKSLNELLEGEAMRLMLRSSGLDARTLRVIVEETALRVNLEQFDYASAIEEARETAGVDSGT